MGVAATTSAIVRLASEDRRIAVPREAAARGTATARSGLAAGVPVGEVRRGVEVSCPMSVVEALADGLPVLGGDRGGVPELVGPGATLPAEDAGAWSEALRTLWEDPAARARAGAAALARARAEHAPEIFYERPAAVYDQPLAR